MYFCECINHFEDIIFYHNHHDIPIAWIPLTLFHHPSLHVSFCRLANIGVSMFWNPQENIAYECIFASFNMSCLSYLDGLQDGRQVAVQLLFCWILFPGFVKKYCSILPLFPSSFSTEYFPNGQMVQQYISTDILPYQSD